MVLIKTVEMLLCAVRKRSAAIHLSVDGRNRASRYTSRHADIDRTDWKHPAPGRAD